MPISNNKILVLGASGMLGSTILRYFATLDGYHVWGTVRSEAALKLLPTNIRHHILPGYISVYNLIDLEILLKELNPDVVINCVGLIKQLDESTDPISAITINSLFPHKLARICESSNCRLIHMSTDCVFRGDVGMYKESDVSDAVDIYGRTKFLGEVSCKNSITLRTSIIGHELGTNKSLLNWFLSQNGSVTGYKNAIFSGLPTIEIAKIIENHVLPNSLLQGVYHLSADPISKFELLKLIASVYGKIIDIVPDEDYSIDRSLDSSLFRSATGFNPRTWECMVEAMKSFG